MSDKTVRWGFYVRTASGLKHRGDYHGCLAWEHHASAVSAAARYMEKAQPGDTIRMLRLTRKKKPRVVRRVVVPLDASWVSAAHDFCRGGTGRVRVTLEELADE